MQLIYLADAVLCGSYVQTCSFIIMVGFDGYE